MKDDSTDKRAVILLSGGVDSASHFYMMLNNEFTMFPIFFDYGQKNTEEASSVLSLREDAVNLYGGQCKELKTFDLTGFFSNENNPILRSGGSVPEGTYDEKSSKETFISGRNSIFLALAYSYAVSKSCRLVCFSCHAERDSADKNYPDCTPEFVEKTQGALSEGCWSDSPSETPVIHSPFVHKTKKDIVKIGYEEGVPFHLTTTCYNGGALPCGKCDTCVERREAFLEAGIVDPLVPEDGWGFADKILREENAIREARNG